MNVSGVKLLNNTAPQKNEVERWNTAGRTTKASEVEPWNAASSTTKASGVKLWKKFHECMWKGNITVPRRSVEWNCGTKGNSSKSSGVKIFTKGSSSMKVMKWNCGTNEAIP